MCENIIHIHECDSTSNYLKQLLISHKPDEGTIVFADYQSAGKGQRGNVWESEKGRNLLFSTILYPGIIKASEQFILSQIISLAVVKTLSDFTDNITIKWPNDIYWKEKKICGILLENTLEGEKIKESVIGVGININQTDFRSDAPNPVSLQQVTGNDYGLEEMLLSVRSNIMYYYARLKNKDLSAIINEYKGKLFRKDGYHLYSDEKNKFFARIKDIELSGILILETKNGEDRKFAFKEVKYIL